MPTSGQLGLPHDDLTDQLYGMRRIAAAMFLIGGTTCAIGALATQRTEFSRISNAGIAAAALSFGLLMLTLRPRRWVIVSSVLASVALLSGLVATSEPVGLTPFFYLWPVVYTAYFCPRPILLATFAWTALSLACALAINDNEPLKVDTFLGTVVTVGMMAALVAGMRNRELRLRASLALAADTDPLTGLLNRRSFAAGFAALLTQAAERHAPLSVVMFDIDHFKRLNDDHGHLVGDEALSRLADVLHAQSRHDDLVSRFGGEEFAVLLPAANLADARAYAQRVASALRDQCGGEEAPITVSAGLTAVAEGDDATTAIARADEALYAAKFAGRDRVAWTEDGSIMFGPAHHGLRALAPTDDQARATPTRNGRPSIVTGSAPSSDS